MTKNSNYFLDLHEAKYKYSVPTFILTGGLAYYTPPIPIMPLAPSTDPGENLF